MKHKDIVTKLLFGCAGFCIAGMMWILIIMLIGFTRAFFGSF